MVLPCRVYGWASAHSGIVRASHFDVLHRPPASRGLVCLGTYLDRPLRPLRRRWKSVVLVWVVQVAARQPSCGAWPVWRSGQPISRPLRMLHCRTFRAPVAPSAQDCRLNVRVSASWTAGHCRLSTGTGSSMPLPWLMLSLGGPALPLLFHSASPSPPRPPSSLASLCPLTRLRPKKQEACPSYLSLPSSPVTHPVPCHILVILPIMSTRV